MNPNEHDTDNQFADLAQIADQDDASAEELQFTAEEIRQLRAEGERRRIDDLKLAFRMFSYEVGVGPKAGEGFLVSRGSYRREAANYSELRQIAIDRGVLRA